MGTVLVEEVHSRRQSGVTVITLDRPVANALAPALRLALDSQIRQAIEDSNSCAIVLTGAGNLFSTGVDITEYDRQLASPWVGDLCSLIENSEKPVVAAIHGSAVGAGFELALAAHARVARTGSKIALPDVGLGLTPGAGGTQRLPRLVGAQAALELMLSGQLVDVSEPRLRGVFDRTTDQNPEDDAIDLALLLAESGKWSRTKDCDRGFSDPERYQNAIAFIKSKLSASTGAESDIVKCVEAALLLPFESGLSFESAIFQDRIKLPEARALRHVFTSERRAAIMPELATGRAAEVHDICFLGAGTNEFELICACLERGKNVHLYDVNLDAVNAKIAGIHSIYDTAVSRKVLLPQACKEQLARLSASTERSSMKEAQLIFDSGKIAAQEIFADENQATWVILNSDFDLARRARETGINERAVGCRIYSPINKSRLVELTVPAGCPADAVATADMVFNAMDMTVVRSAPVTGGPGYAMILALYQSALKLVDAGVRPLDVDKSVKRLGFSQGAFQMIDRDGLQLVRDRINQVQRSRAFDGLHPDNLLDRLINAGAAGRAAGQGFYLYRDDKIHPIPELNDGNPAGVSPIIRTVGPEQAILAALVNEAVRLLQGGVVQRASDLDVLMVKGYGFSRPRGGPLFQADVLGLSAILKNLRLLQPLSAGLWTPDPLIESMVKNGERFFGRVN